MLYYLFLLYVMLYYVFWTDLRHVYVISMCYDVLLLFCFELIYNLISFCDMLCVCVWCYISFRVVLYWYMLFCDVLCYLLCPSKGTFVKIAIIHKILILIVISITKKLFIYFWSYLPFHPLPDIPAVQLLLPVYPPSFPPPLPRFLSPSSSITKFIDSVLVLTGELNFTTSLIMIRSFSPRLIRW